MSDAALDPGDSRLASVWSRITEFASKWPGLTSAFLGLVAALGYPPVHGWWIALPALALWIAHLRQASGWRGALWIGWSFGWAHLTLANNWIATAFTYQSDMPELLGWVAVPLLCIYLAVYPALAALVAHLLARRSGVLAFGAVLASAWIVTEWLRSWVFTGYPWPPLGLILLGDWDSAGMATLLPWLGTYALSGLTLFYAAFLAFLPSAPWSKRRWEMVLVAAAFLGNLAFLMERDDRRVRLDLIDKTDINYTLVQPLIPQEEINDGSKFEEQFQRIARLTAKNSDQSRLVLWPESAVPDYLEDGYPQRYYTRMTAGADPAFARARIGTVIGPQSTLLTGVVNLNIGEGEDGIPRALSARNSVLAINGEGEITDHYAKEHLVPYGEYLPMEDILGAIGLSRLTSGTIPYIPGPGPETLDLGIHGKAGIQICYEIVFSGQVVDQDNRPDYLFNPSNDGWFGSWGPPQHLAQARMRAIEEGLPVLRSTTTGISAVIDANGNVTQHIASGEADAIHGQIPEAKAPTLFSKLGNALPLIWAAVLATLGLGLPRLLALRSARS
ncbi:apolipoprotein N-acyltransferase [Erythrobacter sp. SCSIO 43205]|uniref:apolipoprotein N-acyltransferase n=1 Tax=Erythrobacter sp. SCSIO 43205 TaxID=2779361 RepID=UPI001CA9A42A|nr:apolipoprotein N-acyltransferase [Erythrobacter sp. SCSIO 43205]UAB78277.1 apolipoprotein N-acyltransferase [Erythrobacter sp. SCSIO 43205]